MITEKASCQIRLRAPVKSIISSQVSNHVSTAAERSYRVAMRVYHLRLSRLWQASRQPQSLCRRNLLVTRGLLTSAVWVHAVTKNRLLGPLNWSYLLAEVEDGLRLRRGGVLLHTRNVAVLSQQGRRSEGCAPAPLLLHIRPPKPPSFRLSQAVRLNPISPMLTKRRSRISEYGNE